MRRTLLLGSAAILFTIVASTSFAQTQIETVIVTAQKKAEDIQRVPISIEAFSADEIKERQIKGIQDIGNETPGVQVGTLNDATNITIRGIGLNTLSGDGTSSVAINLDGIYLSTPYEATMLRQDLESVEVLRGPQSTLYGNNASAGVMNLYTPSPTEDFEAAAVGEYGSYGLYKVGASVSGPISDGVTARAFLDFDGIGGWVKNSITGQNLNGLNGRGGDFAVDADLSSDVTLDIRAHARGDDTTGPVYNAYTSAYPPAALPLSAFNFSPWEVKTPGNYDSNRELFGGSAKIVDNLGWATLTSLTGYDYFQEHIDHDGLPNAIFAAPTRLQKQFDTVSQEFDLKSVGSKLDWLAGVYYLHDIQHYTNQVDFPLSTTLIVNVRGEDLSADQSVSGYFDAKYPITNSTRIYGGVRLLRDDQQMAQAIGLGFTIYPGPIIIPPVSPCSVANVQKQGDTNWGGRLGLQQDVDENGMVYAQYARGYKAGGYSNNTCDSPYLPEKVDAFETGYKDAFFNHRATLDISYFHYNYNNLQVESDTITGLQFENAPRAQVDGGEISLVGQPADGLQLNLGVSLLDARYTEFYAADVDLIAIGLLKPGQNLAGNPLNQAPAYTVNSGLEYTVPLGSQLGSLSFRGEARFTGSYVLSEANSPYQMQKPYTLVNLYLTYTDPSEKHSFRLFVENATNVPVLEGSFATNVGLLGTYGMPRIIGGEVDIAL